MKTHDSKALAKAQNNLARMCSKGKVVEKDEDSAV
jgi:TPR repeat protein